MAETAFIVGAGRVGCGLAVALQRAGIEVLGTWSRTAAGARRARRITGVRAASGRLPPAVREAGLIFLTVPDDVVEPMCEALAGAGRLGPGQLVLHCAGSLELAPLAAARSVGAKVGSLHPLQAFSDPALAAEAFEGALGVVDGAPAVRRTLARLARRLGLRPASLPAGPGRRALYHAAAVSAAGHVVALLDLALELFQAAGLNPGDALDGLLALSRGTLGNLARARRTQDALTGPVARGDEAVVAGHLAALEALPEATRHLYRALLGRSLVIARRRGEKAGHRAIARRLRQR